MANINFKTQLLKDLYDHGGNTGNAVHLTYFRTAGSDAIDAEIASLDNRIATFQNAISDAMQSSKPGTEDFPYDKELLKREFMEEVLALMLKRPEYRANSLPFSTQVAYSGGGQDLLRGGVFNTSTPGVTWDGNNFSNMTATQHKAVLAGGGPIVYDTYSAWIDAMFEEGNKLKNNPTDPSTGATVISRATSVITEREEGGVIYNRVATEPDIDPTTGRQRRDAQGTLLYLYYLVAKDATTATAQKVTVNGTSGTQVDAFIGLRPGPTSSTFLQVDKDLKPLGSPAIAVATQHRLMSPVQYLYYWTEARVRVLRGQLNMKEAITSEIRDDLAKANSAYADLEAQAGKTRAQSADGKTVNPDLSFETQNMDFFEATNAKKGEMIFDNNGNDDQSNYSEWGASRSALKSYIDRKSTQSQDAMLDYQTMLNRFNQAYEVMSKLQEKMDGLLKGQLRNIA
jgi:hypothetical protein